MGKLTNWLPFKKQEDEQSDQSGSGTAPLENLRNEVNQLFDRFFEGKGGEKTGSSLQRKSFFGDFSPASFSPSIDLTDEPNSVKVTAELPGLSANDIDVTFQNGSLLLKGQKEYEKTDEDEGYYRAERAYGSFSRVIPIPTDVEADGAEANFQNGVLTVKLPKTGESRSEKKVEISSQ